VRPDGVLGDEQPLRDLFGAVVLVEQQEHFELTGGQDRGDAIGHARAASTRPHLVEQPARDRPRESSVALDDALEELSDALRRLRLEQVARRAAANGGEQILLGPGGCENDDLAAGRSLAQPWQRREAVEAGHQEVEQDEVGLSLSSGRDRFLSVRGDPGELEAVGTQQRRESLAGERVVVHDEDARRHAFLIGSDASADKTHMRRQRTELQAWLWGEIVLFGLLAASLALLLAYPTLGKQYDRPQLLLVLETTMALAGILVALLAGVRFSVTGLRTDLLLAAGFLIWSLSTVAFAIIPALDSGSLARADAWAALAGSIVGQALIASAPFVNGRSRFRERALRDAVLVAGVVLAAVWLLLRAHSGALPALTASPDVGAAPSGLASALAVQAFLNLLAIVGWGRRLARTGDDLAQWLALGFTLLLFASLHLVFAPPRGPMYVAADDYLRLLAFALMLVGAWRAIRSAELGRAVAEERARVAREIHDGLAQYLFAVSTHAQMLEGGTPVEEVGPQLKEAAALAQQEARFAILALSSASGTAPFDSALRRYVEFLTADGELAVDLEIDPGIRLAPDEQIEIFRIVQEGLGNVRRHANATRAEVVIGRRLSGERFVAIEDDGEGFPPDAATSGNGLRNMRDRASSIGGWFSVRSTPGLGTALEVVLRT
jgi:signal transduction histidine kinase